MANLEKMKIEVELMRVKAAKGEQELKIAEREDEINRLQDHVKIQEAKINELELKIKSL